MHVTMMRGIAEGPQWRGQPALIGEPERTFGSDYARDSASTCGCAQCSSGDETTQPGGIDGWLDPGDTRAPRIGTPGAPSLGPDPDPDPSDWPGPTWTYGRCPSCSKDEKYTLKRVCEQRAEENNPGYSASCKVITCRKTWNDKLSLCQIDTKASRCDCDIRWDHIEIEGP